MANIKELLQKPSQQNIKMPGFNLSPTMEGRYQAHLTSGYELVFKNITVMIDKRPILNDVNGVALPGEMLAIMGPSGAGKTTLLNCLAGRKPVDFGELTLDSQPINKSLRRNISYVLQNDIFLPRLTCWETLWYTALLRLPGSMPTAEKNERVYEIVDELDMRKCLKTKIGGDYERGLSGGEKKRTNIACELLTNPALMLLDEPTSGLDSTTAYNLISTIRDFCKKSGKTVVISIHQPSSQIFNLFDKLLLLCDGQVAYYGDIKHCYTYFSSVGLECPNTYNLADYMLDQVKESQEVKTKIIERAARQRTELWYPKQLKAPSVQAEYTTVNEKEIAVVHDSKNNKTAQKLMMLDGEANFQMTNEGFIDDETVQAGQPDELKSVELAEKNETTDGTHLEEQQVKKSAFPSFKASNQKDDLIRYKNEFEAKWPTGFWLQFSVLFRRSIKDAAPRYLCWENITQSIAVAIVVGMLWFQLPPAEHTLIDRQGLLFFILLYSAFTGILESIAGFPLERSVINKERLGGYYRLSAYVLAKNASDLPLIMVVPFLLYTIVFWLSGVNYNFLVYIQLLGIIWLTTILAQGIGQFYGALFLNFTVAFTSASTTMLCVMLAGGFYVRNTPVWALWMKYTSFISYAYYAMLEIDYKSILIECAKEGSQFEACYNQTSSVNSTESRYIPTQVLIDKITLSSEGFHIWHYIVILIGLTLLPRIATYIVLRFIRKPSQV